MSDLLNEQHLTTTKSIITTDTKLEDEILLNSPVSLDSLKTNTKKTFKKPKMKSLTRVPILDKQVDDAPAGKHKRKLGVLDREERVQTGSDIQRLAFKRNLADNIEMDLKNSQVTPEFTEILLVLKEYSGLDINAGSSQAERLHESNTLGSAKEMLARFIASLGPEQEFDKLRSIATLYQNYLALDTNGYLEQPKQEDVIAKKANVLDATNNEIVAKKGISAWEKDSNGKSILVKKEVTVDFRDASKELLFPHEPSVNDICQGGLGDCYLLAGLSSLVDASPQLIKDCLKDNGATVTVRFYEFPSETTAPVPLYVTVPKKVPKNDDYASGSLWVQMIEQAYAASKIHTKKANNPNVYDGKTVYKDIAGGSASDFVQSITGRKRQDLNAPVDQYVTKGSGGICAALEAATNRKLTLEHERAGTKGGIDMNEFEEDIFDLPHKKNVQDIDELMFYMNLRTLRNNIEDYMNSINKYKMTGTNKETGKTQEAVSKAYTIEDYQEMLDTIDTTKIAKVNGMSNEDHVKFMRIYFEKYRKFFTEYQSKLSYRPFSGQYSEHSERTYQQIDEAIADGKIVTASTHQFIPDSFQAGSGLNNEFVEAGLVERHAYTVLGVKTMSKNKYVKLRNPWGCGTRSYTQDTKTGQITRDRVDDDTEGIFLLELNEFTTKFDKLAVN